MFEVTINVADMEEVVQNMGPTMLKKYLNGIDWATTKINSLKIERVGEGSESPESEAHLCTTCSI